ncbi:MAG: hypothetical protein IPM07_12675 [Anaerolineales bacterium]|nr:hypothetical protein [Anaerolineales bacterium]
MNYALAGIFGLVMPFVCWGAEATPGHPHGRAHLVFLAPPVVNQHQSLWAGRNAHDVLAAASSAKTIGQHELCTTPSAPSGATSPMTPVGKSTPLVLAVTLLLLTLFETKILLRGAMTEGLHGVRLPSTSLRHRSPSTPHLHADSLSTAVLVLDHLYPDQLTTSGK